MSPFLHQATVLITLDCWLLFVSLSVLSASIKCLDGQVPQHYRRIVYFWIRILFCLSFITLFLVAFGILKRVPLLMTPWFLTNAAHVIAVPMFVATSEICFATHFVLFTLPLRVFLGLTMFLLYEDLRKADSQEVYFRWYVQHMRQELESDGPVNHSFA